MSRKQSAKARKSPSAVKSRQPQKSASQQVCQIDLLKRALAWIVGNRIFDDLPRHGKTSWLPAQLIVLAILWVWSDCSRLTTGYDEARQTALGMYESLKLCTYQGFLRALVTWTARLPPLL
jgi:hypothetical protein